MEYQYQILTRIKWNYQMFIRIAAGTSFNEYSTTHAGLGVWDVTLGIKFSIEFLAINYTTSLFPSVINSSLIWNNEATIQVTNPLIEENWINSKLIVATSGLAYQDFATYLIDSLERFVFSIIFMTL